MRRAWDWSAVLYFCIIWKNIVDHLKLMSELSQATFLVLDILWTKWYKREKVLQNDIYKEIEMAAERLDIINRVRKIMDDNLFLLSEINFDFSSEDTVISRLVFGKSNINPQPQTKSVQSVQLFLQILLKNAESIQKVPESKIYLIVRLEILDFNLQHFYQEMQTGFSK